MRMNFELEKKREAYELKLARQVEKFAERVNAGMATPDEIAFMSKVADMLDQTRKDALRGMIHDNLDTASRLLGSV
ncbi:hypothetical protein [Eggerthella sinensis]|uniref:Uncharacterized protein n=1 Tax=Eggerthella sinensis TaxID=242230 RepID=A0A3N0ITE9_9ACTN|nr:hypothetical protein [Eggerthella sinensis]RDB63657.1 hypothetical protein C1876_16800 [Eggerthella sinensis]RNM40274.1 hypothetical protein DMP09_15075 [Eggerthella sinensis]